MYRNSTREQIAKREQIRQRRAATVETFRHLAQGLTENQLHTYIPYIEIWRWIHID